MGLLAKATAVREMQGRRDTVRKGNNHRKLAALAAVFGAGLLLLAKPDADSALQKMEYKSPSKLMKMSVAATAEEPPVALPVNEQLESFKNYVANMSEREKDALIKTVYFEMGRSESDWAGVVSVITNRAYQRNRTYSGETQPYLRVLSAGAQFSGYKPNDEISLPTYNEVAARVDLHLRDITEGRFIPMETTGVVFHHANLVERNGRYYIDRTYDHNIYCEDFHPRAADKVENYREISSPYQLDLSDRYQKQKMLLTMGR